MAEDAPAKAEERRAELDNVQRRFDALIQKRNELNDASRQLRQERDLLNNGRQEFRDRLEKAKTERERCNALMAEARTRRNEFQGQAKALIGSRKGKAGAMAQSLPLQVRQLEKQVRDLEFQQQTTQITIEKERELLKVLKAKGTELAQLKTQLTAQREIKVDLDNIDGSISELFAQADLAHKEMQAHYAEAQQHHEEFVKAIEESRVVSREADGKHKEFVAARIAADDAHQKAMELREKMIAIQGERRAEFEADRRELREVNQAARQAVADPRRLEEKAEDDLALLKTGGKIRIGL